ncbi:MAG: hypothetical protein E4H02_11405 [Lentisphaerales bacterium]|nr:MAG: hypothetical protein E4H02_11405 [Lentisphaerales bacterium]
MSSERIVTNPKSIADIIEVFLRAGVDTIMRPHTKTCIREAIKEAEQRVGTKMIVVSTPSFPTTAKTLADGFDLSECEKILDGEVAKGVSVCMLHTDTTDVMIDKCRRELRQMDVLCELIRDRGMIPGLSTHVPDTEKLHRSAYQDALGKLGIQMSDEEGGAGVLPGPRHLGLNSRRKH